MISMRVVKKVCTTPVTILKTGQCNSMGDRNETQRIDLKCFIYSEAKMFINAQGKEELSNTHMYFLDKQAKSITLNDVVLYNGEKNIVAIDSYTTPDGTGHVVVIHLA